MKILLVITKAEIGGAQAFVLNLARGLKKRGNNVVVAAGEGDFLNEELKKDNINFLRINKLKRNRNPLAIIFFIFELKKIIDKGKFDVLHLNSTNALPGVFAARLSRKKPKTFFTVHGLSVLDKNYKAPHIIKLFFKIYFKFFFNFVDKTVFVSQYNLDEANLQKISSRKVLIYNGLELSANYFLSRTEAREKLGSLIGCDLSENYIIGSIGRLATQKNYNFLIKIWPEIKAIKPKSKLIIIGEGPERAKYERLVSENNFEEDIFFPGAIKDASKMLKGVDLFVLPSIYEGLSISLIEAAFADIKILASNVGGNREVIGIDNCFTLNNKEDFISKFKQEQRINVDKMQFSADVMVEKYIKLYGGK